MSRARSRKASGTVSRDAHAGDLAHDVVEALDVLDVDRGVDVDAGVEQLLDVLVAALVAAAGHVAVRQLVDDRDARLAREQGIEIELGELPVLVGDVAGAAAPPGRRAGLGFDAAVGFDQADDHVDVLPPQLARALSIA